MVTTPLKWKEITVNIPAINFTGEAYSPEQSYTYHGVLLTGAICRVMETDNKYFYWKIIKAGKIVSQSRDCFTTAKDAKEHFERSNLWKLRY